MIAAPVIDVDAHLLRGPAGLPHGTSWWITFGIGTPAAGTYTEVRILPGPDGSQTPPTGLPRAVVDAAVETVAHRLYGRAWAFHYPPEDYHDAVGRYALALREVVVIDRIEVYP